MAGAGKEYVIGKGRLFFDRFPVGTKTKTGEAYFGNTPELSASTDRETLEHFDADAGLNVKDESVTIEITQALSFATDNISPENLALWFAGPMNNLTITAAVGENEIFTDIVRGRFYQLGVDATTVTGARNVSNVVVEVGASTITALGNYEVDLEKGRIYIEPDAPDIEDGDDVEVTYDVGAGTRTVIIGKGEEIRGALRFISANPVGAQRDYYWPYVALTSNGDYALKGSEWQQMSFNVEVLKLDDDTDLVYVDASAPGA